MHPIERLRYVARAAGEGSTLLACEAAGALAAFASDPPSLVTACRRLVDRQPTSGAIWWLAARVLGAGDPGAEAWRAASLLEHDGTAQALANALPEDALVTVLGWPEQTVDALRWRGDVRVLVVDACGEGGGLHRRLQRFGNDAELVSESGLGGAAADSDVVIIEAAAMGSTGLVAIAGSRAAAAVGRHAGAKVWAVAGVGRVLPERLWQALASRLEVAADPWDAEEELVPLDLVDAVIGPEGPLPPADALRRADCPIAPELLREVV